MKKLIVTGLLLVYPLASWAVGEDDPLWQRPTFEKKVSQIGQHILDANQIPTHIAFLVQNNTKDVNASASDLSGTVLVEKNLLNYISSDDELAAILSHEIAHITHHHQRIGGIERKASHAGVKGALIGLAVVAPIIGIPALAMSKHANTPTEKPIDSALQRTRETEADTAGLDYMVKAGYNPVAMETIGAKLYADGTAFWQDHPIGRDRLAHIHEVIATKYPQFLIDSKNDPNKALVAQPKKNQPQYILLPETETALVPMPAAYLAKSTTPTSNYLDELEKLDQLRQKGIITQSDFDTKKKQLLGI